MIYDYILRVVTADFSNLHMLWYSNKNISQSIKLFVVYLLLSWDITQFSEPLKLSHGKCLNGLTGIYSVLSSAPIAPSIILRRNFSSHLANK